MLNLPADWSMDKKAWGEEVYYWPIRLLKMLARFPHEYQTWLYVGQSVATEEDPEPYDATTAQCAALIVPCLSHPGDFMKLRLSREKQVHFFSVLPLYREELAYRLKHGIEALYAKLEQAGVGDVVDPSRVNACKRSRWGFPWFWG